MISERDLKKQINILDEYKCKEYESLTRLEKNKILSTMNDEEIFHLEKEINLLIEEYKKALNQYSKSFHLLKIDSFSNYERYHLVAQYHHHLLNFKFKDNKDIEKRKKYFAVKRYETFYELKQKLIKFICSCILYVEDIKSSTKGIHDKEISEEDKINAIKKSISNIKKFLEKVKKPTQENQQIENLSTNFDNNNSKEILKHITSNNLNFVKASSTKEYDSILLNKNISKKDITKIRIRLLNDDLKTVEYNYELYEQVLLAPIKLRFFIDNKHEKNKKSMNLKRIDEYLNNICPLTDEQIEKLKNYEIHNEIFSKIGRNQLIPYCCTVFSEFFSINYFDLKRIYKLFYTENPFESTNFLKDPYNHIKEIEKDEKIYIEEFLPYLDNSEFKKIFYDIEKESLLTFISDKDQART